MLKVVLFASLVIGCKCIQPYNDTSNAYYNEFRSDRWLEMPEFCPVDDQLDFTVNRESERVLAFRPVRVGLLRDGDEFVAQLISISFEFCNQRHPEIQIRLKLLDADIEWKITSQVFKQPVRAIDWLRAETDAILLLSLNPTFARELDEQTEELTVRNTAFKLEWVKEVLLKRPPRVTGEFGDNINELYRYSYVGLPLIIVDRVFDKLEKVRNDMEVHQMP